MTSPTTLSLPGVPDVLHHIFAYLDPVHQQQYDQIYESRRSLALAARACRGFAGPALDVLWKRLPDDQPLADLLCEVGIAAKGEEEDLQLLGENKPARYRLPNQGGGGYRLPGAAEAYERRWKFSRGYDTQYFLRRDIGDPRKHPGWLRFAAYASRVRSITLFAFDGPAWCKVWEELRSGAESAPILPNLLSVAFCRTSWSAPTPGIFALIQSSSLRKLNFSLEAVYAWAPHDEKLRSLFSQIINTAPQIDQLRLAVHPSCLGPSLLHCSRIRRLEVYPQLDFEGLRLLVELPALDHLSTSLVRENLPGAHTPFTLQSITNFHVEGTWTNLSVLFDTVRLPSVRTLSVTGWAYGEPAAELVKGAADCFRAISARRTSITSLSISASFGRVPPPQGCVVHCIAMVKDTFQAPFLDVVHPLLSLSALRHLYLALPTYFDLACSAADLRAVAESFRALETFHLRILRYEYHYSTSGERIQDRPCGGPLDVIAHFARNCPRLRVLHLPPMELTESEGPPAPGPPPLSDGLDSSAERRVHVAGTSDEPHGLRTLIIPRVLLPRGREDLAGKVSEVVRGIFPLAVSPFRLERLTMKDNWVLVDGASRCPECSAWKIGAFL